MTAVSPARRMCCRTTAVDSIQGASTPGWWPIAASRRWAATSILRRCVLKVFMDPLRPFCSPNTRPAMGSVATPWETGL